MQSPNPDVTDLGKPGSDPRSTKSFYVLTLLKCVAYMIVGPSLLVLNNGIEQQRLDRPNFVYPVTLASLGQIFTAVVTWILVKSGKGSVSEEATDHVNNGGGWKGYVFLFFAAVGSRDYTVKKDSRKQANKTKYKTKHRCLIVGVFNVLPRSLGNTIFLHLPMGYIQMLKAFSPVLVLTLLVIFKVEGLPTCHVATSVVVIALFTAATTSVEESATALGLFYMVCQRPRHTHTHTQAMAQGTEAFSLVVTQKLLKKKKFTIVESQYYLAPPSAFFMLLFAGITGEWSSMYERSAYKSVLTYPLEFGLAASLGLLVNYLTFAVIQATSSTMLKVLGTVRNVLAVVAACFLFNEKISAMQRLCYAGTVCIKIQKENISLKKEEKSNCGVHHSLYLCVCHAANAPHVHPQLSGFASYTYHTLKNAAKDEIKRNTKSDDDTLSTVKVVQRGHNHSFQPRL